MRDSTVPVWVARAKTSDGTQTTGWSAADKARGWVEHHAVVDVEWRENGNDGDDRVAETRDGEILGSIRRVDIQDPASFSNRFPDELVSPRFIDPAE